MAAKIWFIVFPNAQVSDTCLPAGRQQAMPKEQNAHIIKSFNLVVKTFFVGVADKLIYTFVSSLLKK